MILVPRDTPGVDHRAGTCPCSATTDRDGHCEIVFEDVRVPATNLHRRGGRGLRHRPGPARPGPDPPLHAADRHGRAGLELMCRRVLGREAFGKPLADQGVDPGVDRRVPHRDRAGPAAGAQDRLADGHRGEQGRAHRDLGHQGRGARTWRCGSSTGRSRPTGRRRVARTSRWRACARAAHPPLRRRARRGPPPPAGPCRTREVRLLAGGRHSRARLCESSAPTWRASARFDDRVLAPLGGGRGVMEFAGVIGYGTGDRPEFRIGPG